MCTALRDRELASEQLERHLFPIGKSVGIEQLRHQRFQLQGQGLKGIGLHRETGNIVRGRNPDAGFIVPLGAG